MLHLITPRTSDFHAEKTDRSSAEEAASLCQPSYISFQLVLKLVVL